MKNIYFCASWLKWCFYTENCYLQEEYTPQCNEEYLPLCKVAIILFLHLKMLCAWRIYTSVWLFFRFFHWWIFTFVRVDKNGVFYTWICYLTEEYTPLYECFSIFTLENVNLCPSWRKWCFLHLNMFSNWRIYTFVQVD